MKTTPEEVNTTEDDVDKSDIVPATTTEMETESTPTVDVKKEEEEENNADVSCNIQEDEEKNVPSTGNQSVFL